MLTIAVLKDTAPGEKRVALVPESVKRLTKLGAQVLLEEGAGELAGFTRRQYEEAGANIVRIVFALDRMEGAKENVEKAGFSYAALLTKEDLGI